MSIRETKRFCFAPPKKSLPNALALLPSNRLSYVACSLLLLCLEPHSTRQKYDLLKKNGDVSPFVRDRMLYHHSGLTFNHPPLLSLPSVSILLLLLRLILLASLCTGHPLPALSTKLHVRSRLLSYLFQ